MATVDMVWSNIGLTEAACLCIPLAEKPHLSDQLSSGTRTEYGRYLSCDLASSTKLIC